MTYTNFPNGLTSQGSPVLADQPIQGVAYFLDAANGDDSYDGKSVNRAFKTLPTAYAALTANQNDTLYYLQSSSSISLTAAFTWAKSYTHFIGVCPMTAMGNRARIFQGAAATGLGSMPPRACLTVATWSILTPSSIVGALQSDLTRSPL